MQYYFNLWYLHTFQKGINVLLKSKSTKNFNTNKFNSYKKEADKIIANNNKDEINDSKKETLMKLVDIITNFIKRNKKIEIDEKDDLFTKKKCLELWHNKTNFKNQNTIKKIVKKNYITDSNKKYISKYNINNNTINNNKNKTISDKSNNKNKSKKILKINKILKKLINAKDIEQKRIYFEKWLDYYPVERTNTTPYSKPKIPPYINEMPSPMSAENDQNLNNFKLNKIKNELIANVNTNTKRKLDFQYKNKEEFIKGKSREIIFNTDKKEFDINNDEENSMKSDEEIINFIKKEVKLRERRRSEIDEFEEQDYNEINNYPKNKKYIKKLKGNKTQLLKIKNKLSNILEKINNKKIIYLIFKYWYDVSLNKNKKIKNDIFSPRKNMPNIIKRFSTDTIEKNNDIMRNYYKTEKDDDNAFKVIFSNNKRNQKRIILKNEIEDKKRSNTLLKSQSGNYSINTENSNDENNYNEDKFEDEDYNALKNFSTMNIISYKKKTNTNNEKKLNNNKSVNNFYIKYNKKNSFLSKENDKNINKYIFDMSKKNVNAINKNASIIEKKSNIKLRNELRGNYTSLLKKNYNTMVGFQIFYLYSLYNERDDYYKLKYIFNKMKKKK